MVYIYALQLEQGKYYIGKTNNPSFRLENHFHSPNPQTPNYGGASWTRRYKPISVVEIIPNCDDYDEDKHTLRYMDKHGINNVRGGSFCEMKLNDSHLITINQMLNSVSNNCYICGNIGHFAKDCKKESTKNEQTNIETSNPTPTPAPAPTPNPNAPCNCPTSYFSPHRIKKCFINNL